MLTSSGINQASGGYQDDGEPKKCAGWPIFKLIEQHDLTNLCVLVTRYFGGVKLGAGGLIRAYQKSAQMVIEQLLLENVKTYYWYQIEFSLTDIKLIDRFCQTNALAIEQKSFQEKVVYTISSQQQVTFTNLPVKIITEQTEEIR